MDGAPALQVPERFPMAPAPKQSAPASSVADNRVRPCTHVKSLKGGWESAPASSVADNRVRPCTHVKSLKGGWEVVELTPSAF
ncbi:hypothetical protein [Pseudomonas aeruginosa]|uniref:hypothetical protein n=1 Tax=Pseudomonas aeruginosa TaxID=287 RepID=UPI000F82FABD|nr:hypothetical protein [Pseudomonas aeruginosa]RTW04310.1 hypothetical protein DY996_09685 [Pseudomonas aeruginosa]